MKILIYSAWLGVILLMAATIGLIKMNWSEKLYTPLLSLFIVGILSTFVTVFVMLKETKKEDEFLTYIVINEKQHLPPNIFQGRSTKLKERLMELSYLGRPTTRDDSISSLSIEQPKNVTEMFTYGCELLQYKIIIDLCEMQLYGPTLYSTFDGGVRTSIQTKYRTTDMEKISGPEVLKIVSTNRFSKSIMEQSRWENNHYLLLPSNTRLKVLHRPPSEMTGSEQYIIVLQKPFFFTIDIIIEGVFITHHNSIPEGIELPPDEARECKTYIFIIKMKARFEKYTAANWRTEEYKAWTDWLFSQIKERLAD